MLDNFFACFCWGKELEVLNVAYNLQICVVYTEISSFYSLHTLTLYTSHKHAFVEENFEFCSLCQKKFDHLAFGIILKEKRKLVRIF